jgi:Domain of unknown function (DUF5666)
MDKLRRRIQVFISKRILIISGIVAVILAGVIGFGFAFAFSQINQASTQNATPTDAPTTVGSVTSVTSGQRACILGIVQSLSNQSFVVSANQGKRVVTVTVTDQTTYSKHGNQASSSFADLAVGNRVRVTAQGQCNRKDTAVVAQSVTVLASTGGLTPIATASPTP